MDNAWNRAIHRVRMNGCRLKVESANRVISEQEHDEELMRLPVRVSVNDKELTGMLLTCNFNWQLEAIAIHVTSLSPLGRGITEHDRLTGCDERIHG